MAVVSYGIFDKSFVDFTNCANKLSDAGAHYYYWVGPDARGSLSAEWVTFSGRRVKIIETTQAIVQ